MLNDPTVIILMYFILPLWLAAGFADWLCHRASHIETTTGAKESLLHLLMFAEIGLPLLAAMFLEINGLIIAVMLLAFVAHEATALWDVSYATTARTVTPIEQHVHSFLEIIPLMAARQRRLATLAAISCGVRNGIGALAYRSNLEIRTSTDRVYR